MGRKLPELRFSNSLWNSRISSKEKCQIFASFYHHWFGWFSHFLGVFFTSFAWDEDHQLRNIFSGIITCKTRRSLPVHCSSSLVSILAPPNLVASRADGRCLGRGFRKLDRNPECWASGTNGEFIGTILTYWLQWSFRCDDVGGLRLVVVVVLVCVVYLLL